MHVMDVYKRLPRINCGQCGKKTCMAFASEFIKGDLKLSDCTPLNTEEYEENRKRLEQILEKTGKAEETGLLIYEDLCNGCGNCVIACPVSAMNDEGAAGGKGPTEDDVVLKVVDGRVVLVDLEKCRRAEGDTRCRVCVQVCGKDAIKLV